jgi:hypothetical protein
MKDICSYFYSRLDGAEAQEEPTDLTNAVKEAMDHILTNVGLLGLTLINLEILKGSLEVYTKQLWVFLNEMENSLVPTAEEVITKCDMPWLKERMREYPVFTSLLRRKRQHVLKSMLKMINSNTPEFRTHFNLDPAVINTLFKYNDGMIRPEGIKNNVCMTNWIKSKSDVFESNTKLVDHAAYKEYNQVMEGHHQTSYFNISEQRKADNLPILSMDTLVSTPAQVL